MDGGRFPCTWEGLLKTTTGRGDTSRILQQGASMADKSKFIEYIDDALEKSKETALSHLFFTYQGIPYPVTMCTSETLRALDTFEARSDDIVLASYPKCGKENLFP